MSSHAPGRVNLIGDHVDYAGGVVLPMAIDLGTAVSGVRAGDRIELTSDADDERCRLSLPMDALPHAGWSRLVAAVALEVASLVEGAPSGLVGSVTTTLPVGAGLSSSASLAVAVALALGARRGDDLALARACQRAEQRATGVPCGLMDQLAVTAGVEGSALLIDCAAETWRPVPLPDDLAVWVVHSGEPRSLVTSAYAERRASVTAAAELVGPLRRADAAAVEAVTDPVLRRRARHVVTEIGRVTAAAEALETGDVTRLGRLMHESHLSLRDDFEVSTPALDALVAHLMATPGVLGARLTGAGFGGCVVVIGRPGAVEVADYERAWRVRAADGARLVS